MLPPRMADEVWEVLEKNDDEEEDENDDNEREKDEEGENPNRWND